MTPYFLECRDDARGDQMPVVRRGSKQIDCKRVLCRWVEIYHFVGSPRWNVVKDVQGQIAVRVNDADTPPGLDVLKNEIAEQGGFSRACLSDDIDMLAALGEIGRA